VVRVALGLAVEPGITGQAEALSGRCFTGTPVDAGTLVGTVRAPVALRTPKGFAPGTGEPGGAGADVGLVADPVLAGFVADLGPIL